MKNILKYIALTTITAASLGIVACNNNTRSLEGTSSPAADNSGAPSVAAPVLEQGTSQVAVEFGIIDSDNRGDTFTVSGQLSADGEDAKYLEGVNGEKVFVTRVKTMTGFIDFGFYYKGLRSDGIPSIYMSHQDQKFFLYKLPNTLPNDFNTIAEFYFFSREEALTSLGKYLGSASPSFVTPSSSNPNGNTLPVNVIQQWEDKLENDLIDSV